MGTGEVAGKYLRHVDGLRAVAVLAVLLYHYGVPGFGGGYVGVDVFFVISGFLITRLIVNEVQATGAFSFANFYIRRMRRLFPALLATLLLTFLAAAVLYSPDQFQRFGKTLAAAVFSFSNVQFWQEAGYFDASSHTKPLLHTWSLSVEEQFYLVWPAAILLAWRCLGARWLIPLFAAAGLASLALNHIWVTGGFDADFRSTIFYLPFFRIFEFVIGAIGVKIVPALANRRGLSDGLMIAGLVAIALSVALYDDRMIFPYVAALLPSIGALLVIVAGAARWSGAIVSNTAAVAIGKISYSLYLVHWPLLVFFGAAAGRAPETTDVAVLALSSIALAAFFYRYIETPFRRGAPSRAASPPQRAFVAGSLAAMAAVGLMGVEIGKFSDGWAWRKPRALTPSQILAGRQRRYDLIKAGCSIDSLDKAGRCAMDRPFQLLVIGNSHEPDGYNAFATVYGTTPEVNLISFGGTNDCGIEVAGGRPVARAKWRRCGERTAKLADPLFVKSLDAVVLSSNHPFAPAMRGTWDVLAAMKQMNPDLRLVVLSSYLNTTADCVELFNRDYTFDTCKSPEFVAGSLDDERRATNLETARQLDYLYIDKVALFCPGRQLAACEVEAGREPMTYDRHHLSLAFAAHLGHKIAAAYGGDLARLGFPNIGASQ